MRFYQLAFVFFALQFPGFSASKLEDITLVATANRSGEVEPCGCQVNQIGGMNRFEAWLNSQRGKGPVIFVDIGDTFFSALPVTQFREARERVRALWIAEQYAYLGLEVLTPGEKDFGLGLEFARRLEQETKAKWVSANLADAAGKLLYAPFAVIEKNGQRYGFIGLSNPEAMDPVAGVKVTDPKEALKKALGDLKGKGVKNIFVLSHLGLVADRELFEIDKDLKIFGAHSLDPKVEKNAKGTGVIIQPQHEGQQIAVMGPDQVTQLIDLGKNFDVSNVTKQKMVELRRVLAVLDATLEAPTAQKTKLPFIAHPAQCRSCHQKQHDFWETTKHATAMLPLYSKNQHLDPDCIGCHTLGYQTSGGFKKATEMLTRRKGGSKVPFIEEFLSNVFEGDSGGALDSRMDPARYNKLHDRYITQFKELEKKRAVLKSYMGIQCEHCHGVAANHPGKKSQLHKVSVETCKTCHREPNAPAFSPEMVSFVACPANDPKN